MTAQEPASSTSRAALVRRSLVFVAFAALVLALWEGVKFIGGDTSRSGDQVLWDPPLKIWFATDTNLPHTWDIVAAMIAPLNSGTTETLGGYLVLQAIYTWREAFIGFALGGMLGVALAIAFIHNWLAERTLSPYVIASQTIPIVALAPMIVFFVGHNMTSVVIIATYLSFFPVTIAMLRGLRSPDPRALELMRSYAANRRAVLWKLRLPASLPYLFTALKITATASIVGAIVGEGPGGIRYGLGRAILFFSQQYTIAPEKLWAAILVTAALGILFYGIVRMIELRVLRRWPEGFAG
ncbi:MAG: ABC transporter permease [Actinomycetota bacterium]|nr:ABC transporter permease [Actinomycetota bacterium]